MVKKLAALELVDHAPYKGVRLTAAGERVAVEVIRHHRLLELYLAETLGLDVEDVHDEADRLEHVLSEELEARIDRALGVPTHDPHGDPIPHAKLEWPNSRERSEATNHLKCGAPSVTQKPTPEGVEKLLSRQTLHVRGAADPWSWCNGARCHEWDLGRPIESTRASVSKLRPESVLIPFRRLVQGAADRGLRHPRARSRAATQRDPRRPVHPQPGHRERRCAAARAAR